MWHRRLYPGAARRLYVLPLALFGFVATGVELALALARLGRLGILFETNNFGALGLIFYAGVVYLVVSSGDKLKNYN